MHDLNKMSEREIREAIAKFEVSRIQRLAYNKTYRKSHPLTEEARATRLAYNKLYTAKRRAFERALVEKAQELGLLT